MDKKLKEALTDIRDDMVKKDELLEQKSEKLGYKAQDKISKKINKPKIFTLFTKRNLAIAASFLLVLGLLASPFINAFRSMLLTTDFEYTKPQAPGASYNDTTKEDASSDFKSAGSLDPEEAPAVDAPAPAPNDSGSIGQDGQVDIFPTLPSNSSEKIIYTFKYKIESKDYDKTATALNKAITENNAYIEDASMTSYSGALRFGEFLVRVPKENSSKFQSAMNGLGIIINHSISSENKTKEYKDMDILKQTLEIKEKRYLSLLEKAETVEDMMNIESRLAEVEMQKNMLKQELDTIDYDVKFQNFSLTIQEVKETSDPVGVEPSFSQKIGREFINAFFNFYVFLQNLSLFVVRNFIGILIVGVALIFIYRKWIRKPKNKAE